MVDEKIIILSQKVEITWSPSNTKYYKCKGYKYTKIGDVFEVNVADLLDGSGAKVQVQCPNPDCKRIRVVEYKQIIKKKHTYCTSCTKIKKNEIRVDEIEKTAFIKIKNNKNYIEGIIDLEDLEKVSKYTWALSGVEKYISSSASKFKTNNKSIRLHNIILGHNTDNIYIVVDHINGNIYDNRKINLRIVTQTENQLNKKMQKNNKSGFRGIHFDIDENAWTVQIRKNNKMMFKKRYEDFTDAYKVCKEKQQEIFGEYMYDVFNDARNSFRYSDIVYGDTINGNGLGVAFYTQGCSSRCKGCFNQSTWDFNGGKQFTKEILNNIISFTDKYNKSISRLSLLGGDPLDNLDVTRLIVAEFKYYFPNKEVWVWTGKTFEELLDKVEYKAILEMTDILIDGKFIEEQKNLKLQFRGSDNQRIIDVQESLKQNRVILKIL